MNASLFDFSHKALSGSATQAVALAEPAQPAKPHKALSQFLSAAAD
jgi:hypothetical protein